MLLVTALIACTWFGPDVVRDAVPGVDRPAELETVLRAALGDDEARFVNRLARSSSPYLRDHATNPVDWSEWGDEALQRAERDNRLVFLSIGYATCHWCHVMAHESFEDEEIARLLNTGFVPIKVDREQRPDVDEIYMDAVHLLGGRGGWPLTAVLTPDGQPLFAATYLPARDGDRGARKGLLSVLRWFVEEWERDPAKLIASARSNTARLVAASSGAPPGDLPGPEALSLAIEQLRSEIDPVHGGFGDAPKFPTPIRLDLLLAEAARRGDDTLREPVLAALHHMARGGIHDPIEGGFHRYATDRAWRVPHFEKMLYDNAQLLSTYARAAAITGDPELRWVTAATARFLTETMATPSGPFVAALDADSPGPDGAPEEGAYYTFTPAEVPDGASFAQSHFAITPAGNLDGRSVPSLVDATAAPWSDPRAEAAREALAAVRATRTPPDRDDQVVVAWNALAISGLVDAYRTLGDRRWLDAALRVADALYTGADDPARPLSRLAGADGPPAMLEDEANSAVAALDLFGATGDVRWLRVARARLAVIDERYAEPSGGWFRTPGEGELLRRPRTRFEGAEPSGIATAVQAHLRLAHLTETPPDAADRALRAFAEPLGSVPVTLPAVLAEVSRRHAPSTEIVVVWPDGADPAALTAVLGRHDLPHAEVITGPASALAAVGEVPLLEGKVPRDDLPTAYVCRDGTCQFPVTAPGPLDEAIRAQRAEIARSKGP